MFLDLLLLTCFSIVFFIRDHPFLKSGFIIP